MDGPSPASHEQPATAQGAAVGSSITARPVDPLDAKKAFSTWGCNALITGASGGLGAEFARQLAPKAKSLLLAARSADKLQSLSDELVRSNPALRVITIACDLATDEGRARLWERVDALDTPLDLLINNAGHGDYGGFREAGLDRIRSQIDLNITALTLTTHAFLNRIRPKAEKPAAILNVSSLAASSPVPDLTVYAATKSYVTSFSEGLAIELADRHVHVLAVCPGPTPTNFSSAARRADGTDTDRSGQDFLRMPPEKVVSIGLQSLEAGRRRVHPGAGVKLANFLFEKMPRGLLRAILAARYRRAPRPSSSSSSP